MGKPAALLTGGSSGIGLAIARELGRRGHNLVLVARDPARLALAADELRAAGAGRVETIGLDLAAEGAGESLRSRLEALRLPVGILVSNAAAFASGALAHAPSGQVAAVVALNVTGLHAAVQAVLPGMLARGVGRIMNVGSLAGLAPTPSFAIYGASKAFVHSYTFALREELRGTGVLVSLLAPGLVRTDLVTRASASPLTHWAYRLASSPETVALCAYRGMMAGNAVVVPGLSGRLLWYGMRLVPARVRARITHFAGRISDGEGGLPGAPAQARHADAAGGAVRVEP